MLPVLFLLAAMLFFGLYMQGEYVKKIFYQVRGRPMFIVKEDEKSVR